MNRNTLYTRQVIATPLVVVVLPKVVTLAVLNLLVLLSGVVLAGGLHETGIDDFPLREHKALPGHIGGELIEELVVSPAYWPDRWEIRHYGVIVAMRVVKLSPYCHSEKNYVE